MNIKKFFENITSFFKKNNLNKPRIIEGVPLSPTQASLIPLTNAEYMEDLKEIDTFFLSTLKLSISDAQDILDAGYKPTSKVKKIIANDLLVTFATHLLNINYAHINTLNTSISPDYSNERNIQPTIKKIKFLGLNELLLPETLFYFFNKNFGDHFLQKQFAYNGLDSYGIFKFFISTAEVLLQNESKYKLMARSYQLKEWNDKYSDIILTKDPSDKKSFSNYYKKPENSGDSTMYRKDIYNQPFSEDTISNAFIKNLINELIKSNKITPQEIFKRSLYNNTPIATNILSQYKKDIFNNLTNEHLEHIILYFQVRLENKPFFEYLSNIQKEVHSNLKNVMIKKLHNENYEQAIINFDFIKLASSLNLSSNIKAKLNNIQTKINDLENSELNAENKNFIKNFKNEIINTVMNYSSVQELDKNFNKDDISKFISDYEFSITQLQQKIVSEQLNKLTNNKVKFK